MNANQENRLRLIGLFEWAGVRNLPKLRMTDLKKLSTKYTRLFDKIESKYQDSVSKDFCELPERYTEEDEDKIVKKHLSVLNAEMKALYREFTMEMRGLRKKK